MAYPSTTIYSEIVTTFERVDYNGRSIALRQSSNEVDSARLDVMFYYLNKASPEYVIPGFRRYDLGIGGDDLRYIVYDVDGKYGIWYNARTDQDNYHLRDYITYVILKSLAAAPMLEKPKPPISEVDHAITSLFERSLLFDVRGYEGWNGSGKRMFLDKLTYYTSQNLAIEMALPAFPCKTTNIDKAASRWPDGAEFEALLNLQNFCRGVEAIYKPGCSINIVSDGHVFADCQGTDDVFVTVYGTVLSKMMTTKIGVMAPCYSGGIHFYNLSQLLLPNREADHLFNRRHAELGTVKHPVRTKTSEVNDLCRTILVRTFGPPKVFYQDLIKTQPEHDITVLYRGFSRFMFDDLAYHPDYRYATISQRKKAAENVALEMIQRNQCYSRLVECVLPRHIRLSIHAHSNHGPKFAVRLITFKPVGEVNDIAITQEEAVSESKEHLHVPTPWHNSVVDVFNGYGSHQTMLCKSKVAREAISSGKWTGRYNNNHPRGGRFVLKPVCEASNNG